MLTCRRRYNFSGLQDITTLNLMGGVNVYNDIHESIMELSAHVTVLCYNIRDISRRIIVRQSSRQQSITEPEGNGMKLSNIEKDSWLQGLWWRGLVGGGVNAERLHDDYDGGIGGKRR